MFSKEKYQVGTYTILVKCKYNNTDQSFYLTLLQKLYIFTFFYHLLDTDNYLNDNN